jgi:hypothetical protein
MDLACLCVNSPHVQPVLSFCYFSGPVSFNTLLRTEVLRRCKRAWRGRVTPPVVLVRPFVAILLVPSLFHLFVNDATLCCRPRTCPTILVPDLEMSRGYGGIGKVSSFGRDTLVVQVMAGDGMPDDCTWCHCARGRDGKHATMR